MSRRQKISSSSQSFFYSGRHSHHRKNDTIPRKSLMLLPVFPRGGADIGLEYPGKVADGGKPEIRPDGGEGLIGIAEEALGFLGLFLQNKIGEGLAGFFLEPAGEIGLRRFT